MAVQITDKFQYFKDLDGNALNNGYVYIGTSGFNAEVSTISVYSDEALTIPVAQPIRTIGGYMVNNGIPINIYTSADYSIMVKDSNETLIYSSLSDNINSAQERAESAAVDAEQAVIDAAAAAEAVLINKVDKSGDTMTGQLKGITPVSAEDLARKDYVDELVGDSIPLGGIESGTYTPVITNEVNIDNIVVYDAKYIMIGNIVVVTGAIAVDATSASSMITFELSIPVDSFFSLSHDLNGSLSGVNSATVTGAGDVSANSTNNTADFDISVTSQGLYITCGYTYSYEVINAM